MSAVTRSSILRYPPFAWFFAARVLSELSQQIAAVALGWQIYTMTNSAAYLGLAGLAQFMPTALLTFVAGGIADRFNRQRVAQFCQATNALTGGYLALGAYYGWLSVSTVFLAVIIFGVTTAFENPAVAALLPATAPQGELQRATALGTGAFQVAIVSGPALGGLAYSASPVAPWLLLLVTSAAAAFCSGAIAIRTQILAARGPTFTELFAGVSFVRRNPAILGSMSLDLFAVLLGGVTALMPIYARDMLHTGPWGLGILRGAPAIGALLMTAWLAHRPLNSKAGLRLLQAVMVFGFASVVFGLSTVFWLSLAALAVMGAADTVSMVLRISLVQLATPDHMRGRVGAVNFLFVNASSQLGEFESGMTAALLGAMPSVVLGGLGTILVAFLWMKVFPTLRDLEYLDEVQRTENCGGAGAPENQACRGASR
jgi:MFS family permease